MSGRIWIDQQTMADGETAYVILEASTYSPEDAITTLGRGFHTVRTILDWASDRVVAEKLAADIQAGRDSTPARVLAAY